MISNTKQEVKFEGATNRSGMPNLMPKKAAETKDIANKGTDPLTRKLIIVRHGATEMNDPNVERIRGQTDTPLNSKGKEEAEAMGERLKGLVDVIISSDQKRAKETAELISQKTGAKILAYSKALRSWDTGIFTGQKADLVLNDLFTAAKRSPDDVIPGGESFNQFKGRFLKEMELIEKKIPDLRVAVVTHHRNQVMYDAWKKKGAKPDLDFDWNTFVSEGIPPGDFQIY